MKLRVRVSPRAKQRRVDAAPDGTLLVRVTEPAEGGRANAAVIEALAEYWHVPRRQITIVQGHASRQKLIEIAA